MLECLGLQFVPSDLSMLTDSCHTLIFRNCLEMDFTNIISVDKGSITTIAIEDCYCESLDGLPIKGVEEIFFNYKNPSELLFDYGYLRNA